MMKDFDKFLRDNFIGVYRFCRAWLKNPDLANDATVAIMLKAKEEYARLQSARDPIAFLFGIARNVCRDTLRQCKSQDAHECQMPEDFDPKVVVILFAHSAGLEAKLVRVILNYCSGPHPRMDCLARMRLLGALLLRFIEGMGNTRIAEILEQPPGTVHAWIRRFLVWLRNEVQGPGFGGDHDVDADRDAEDPPAEDN
ncbi:MAG: RNA polymerase sigma factor [Fimbriimonadaceae bacterium]|nr:RNA polymerase sigma factor [Fimbriimonadaceae bacterium]